MGEDGKRDRTERCLSRNTFVLKGTDWLCWLRKQHCSTLLGFQDSVMWEIIGKVGGSVGRHWKFVVCHWVINDFTS